MKGESYSTCSRQLTDKPPAGQTELIGGVEMLAGLVARITEEQMVLQVGPGWGVQGGGASWSGPGRTRCCGALARGVACKAGCTGG